MSFNVYDDAERAASYARLEFPGTYYLAFRDIPGVIGRRAGRTALDFGCGAGRSTRFLKGLGLDAVGIDISPSMVAAARAADLDGEYLTVPDGDYSALGDRRFDVVFSAFAFDNIPDRAHRGHIVGALAGRLSAGGALVILGSAPEIYVHEWASFTTSAFPSNRSAKSGDEVWTVMKDVTDGRPVRDVLWTHEDYVGLIEGAGLVVESVHRPLGRPEDGVEWVTETTVAPWVIYVAVRPDDPARTDET
ncbi:MAG: methyltransferase domain-containing protein [Armatimonadetes bacterium]|nr:methyltransferase domain-containing protein [Armatimonadota bacterium]